VIAVIGKSKPVYRGLTRMSADRKTFYHRGHEGTRRKNGNLTTDEHRC